MALSVTHTQNLQLPAIAEQVAPSHAASKATNPAATQHKPSTHTTSPTKSKRSLKHKLHTAIQQAEDTGQQNQSPERIDAKSLCLQLLTEGRPAAFVDFFQLTHQAPLAGQVTAPTQDIPEDVLLYVKQQLSTADASNRNGDLQTVYDCYIALARMFEGLDDTGKAKYFYTKARVTAQDAGWADKELSCLLALGQMCKALGDLQQAVQHHEMCRTVAAQRSMPEQEQEALKHIADCYGELAAAEEAAGRDEAALQQYSSCLAAADAGRDSARSGQVHYKIGRLLQHSSSWQQALEHHQQGAELLRDSDALAAGRAMCAAAECQQQMGDLDQAAQILEEYLKESRGKDTATAAAACCSTGVIYYQQRKWDAAVKKFARFFSLAQAIGNRQMADVARVNLGLAQGAMRMSRYWELVDSDLPALIEWKNCNAWKE